MRCMAVMDFSLPPAIVEVGPDAPAQFPDSASYLGLTGDKFLNARCVSMVRGPVQYHMAYQSWSFEMECIDNPPEWQDGSRRERHRVPYLAGGQPGR